jgi:hypothetical protein
VAPAKEFRFLRPRQVRAALEQALLVEPVDALSPSWVSEESPTADRARIDRAQAACTPEKESARGAAPQSLWPTEMLVHAFPRTH